MRKNLNQNLNPSPFDQKQYWTLDGGSLWPARALKDTPELIFEKHGEYLKAGADILRTASYQTSFSGFLKMGMYLREARETIFSSVMLACMAREKYKAESGEKANRPILIGASIGPCEVTIENRADFMRGDEPMAFHILQEYFEPKIEALLSPRKNYRVDFLAFETMTSLEEVKFVLNFMKRYPGARLTVSFSRPEEALRGHHILDKDPQVAAWGFNCLGADVITKALNDLKAIRTGDGPNVLKPLIVYPNGPVQLGYIASEWRDLGAHIIGGCCQTTSFDISEIAKTE